MGDDVVVDNDVLASGVQHSIDLTVAPGDPVSTSAQMVVDYQGSKHLTADTDITVSVDAGTTDYDGVAGVNVGDASGKVPNSWTSASPDFTLTSAISFNAPTIPGTYNLVIHYTPTSYTCVSGDDKCLSPGTGDPFLINLTVSAPTTSNTAPVVDFTGTTPTAATEGQTKTFNFSITDPNTSDTFAFASGYPSCGTDGDDDPNTLVSSSIDQDANTGTFDCKFIDGLATAVNSTVKVKVTDGTAASNELTTLVSVSNVAPTVAQPAFASTSVDCQSSVTLTGISFTDPGADANWSGSIDWGDNSTDSTFTATATGAQSNVSHTYTTGGTFTATVTVTDKDGQSGSNTSSNTVTVVQYSVDFLPPFDDSSPSGLIVNKMKNGRVVPVKATIYDMCAQAFVTDPTTAVSIAVPRTDVQGGTPSDPVETYADAGLSSGGSNAFRWSSDGFWIYNLDSKALALVTNTVYRIDIYVGTGSARTKATVDDWAVLQPVK